ncbi:MAG: nitrilase-related carbon-nitrogen hydrolase [Bacteroidota bacterium]
MQDLTVAIIQSDLTWENAEANLARFDNWLARINKPADLIVFPEMFNTAFSMNPSVCAENPDGKTMLWLQEKAAEKNCVITASLLTNENGKYFNRLIWISPDGKYQHYDKKHLFRFAGEHEVFSAGKGKITPEINGWKFRPLVCYDLRFPVWCMNSYTDGGFEFDCLLFIANWPDKRRDAWLSLLMARAIDNQAYVIGVNRVGVDGKGNYYSGDSMIIDPKGNIIVQIPAYEEAIEFAILSYSEMQIHRDHFRVGPDWDKFKMED